MSALTVSMISIAVWIAVFLVVDQALHAILGDPPFWQTILVAIPLGLLADRMVKRIARDRG